MEKMTYREWVRSQAEAKRDFKGLSEEKKKMANEMYKILKRHHVGRDNVICADALAEEMTEKLGKDINRAHVAECARLFREYGNFPGLQSCVRGYYVDETYAAMVKTLRFVYTKSLQIERTAFNIRDIINEKYGEGAIPEDMREWLKQLEYEEWCEENDIEPDDDDDL